MSDPILAYQLLFGPGTAYKYRLEGPHPWHGARDAIMTTRERVEIGFNPNKNKKKHMMVSKKGTMDLNGFSYVHLLIGGFILLVIYFIFN